MAASFIGVLIITLPLLVLIGLVGAILYGGDN